MSEDASQRDLSQLIRARMFAPRRSAKFTSKPAETAGAGVLNAILRGQPLSEPAAAEAEMEPVLDDDGEPVVDENGEAVMQPKRQWGSGDGGIRGVGIGVEPSVNDWIRGTLSSGGGRSVLPARQSLPEKPTPLKPAS